jgi:succinate dehydrogenase assembly factor 2
MRRALHSSRRHFPQLQRCWYRGDSGEAKHNLSAAEEALLQIAKPKSEKILARHIRLPSLKDVPKSASLGSDDELAVRKKRLIYRSKQRGWSEVDLLLGTWASTNVPSLTADELNQFEDFVNMETIDIYNIITLRLDIPEELKTPDESGVVERIQVWARNSPLGKADPAKYKQVKTSNNLI